MWTRCKELFAKLVEWMRKCPHLCVFLFFLVLHLFIFRDVVTHIPAMVRGDEVLAREELIPFFNFKTQFFDQLLGGISPLTQTSEVRISYSFLTAWVRYYAFLPFAMVLVPTTTAFFLYLAFFSTASTFLVEARKRFLVFAAVVSATFFHLVLLQSKITHFYELMFGFALFTYSLSLLLELFAKGATYSSKKRWLLSLTVLCNPGIHYHFLFLFVLAVVFVYFCLIHRQDRAYLLSILRSVGLAAAVSTVPYVLLIWYVITHSGNIANAIPLGYSTIFYSSVGISQLASFDIASIYDMFSKGVYIDPIPRIWKIGVLIFALCSCFGFKQWSRTSKIFYWGLVLVGLLGAWFSLGYLYGWSAHAFLAFLVRVTHEIPLLGHLVERLVTNFLQVLRFPHRFEFIYFYAVGSLATIGMYSRIVALQKHRLVYSVLFAVAILFPFVLLPSYSVALWSGDFGGFLTPYPVSRDLKEIKTILDKKPGLSMVVPTFESGRVLEGSSFNFVDKFIIYYLNSSFLYYGSAASLENKFKAFAVYEAMIDGGKWWDKYLKTVVNLDYIVVPKMGPRSKGRVYVPQIDPMIEQQLASSTIYEVAYKGSQYTLYQRRDIAQADSPANRALFLDMSYAAFGKTILGSAFLDTQVFLPVDAQAFANDKHSNKVVLTDKPKAAYFDLLDHIYPEIRRYVPDDSLAPFDRSYTLSTDYSTSPLNLAGLLPSKTRLHGPNVKHLVNMTVHNFLISTQNPITFNQVTLPAGENYLLLKAASTSTGVTAAVNGQDMSLERLEMTSSQAEFVYYVGVFQAPAAEEVGVRVQSVDRTYALAVESLLVVPKGYYLSEIGQNDVGSPKLKLISTKTKDLYTLRTK